MQLEVIRQRYDAPGPAFDTAVSRQILQEVADGLRPDTLRLHIPPRVVAFGKRDVVAPGYPAAIEASIAQGFSAVERLAGGRAAVFHESTIAFAMASSIPDPRLGITERFEIMAKLMRDALVTLGIRAEIGELPGEYCPGRYSVHAGGRKLVGIGQRLIRGAAHVGGVMVVKDSNAVRSVLVPVYEALQLAWDPDTTGAIEDISGNIAVSDVIDSVLGQFEQMFHLTRGQVDTGTEAAAMERMSDHQPGVR